MHLFYRQNPCHSRKKNHKYPFGINFLTAGTPPYREAAPCQEPMAAKLNSGFQIDFPKLRDSFRQTNRKYWIWNS